MNRRRSTAQFLAMVVLTGAAVTAGRLGDRSMRDPAALAALAVMIAAFCAALFLSGN